MRTLALVGTAMGFICFGYLGLSLVFHASEHDGPDLWLADTYSNDRLLAVRSNGNSPDLVSCSKDRTWSCKVIPTNGMLHGKPALARVSGMYAFASENGSSSIVETRMSEDKLVKIISVPGRVWSLSFSAEGSKMLAVVSLSSRLYSMGGTTTTNYQIQLIDVRSGVSCVLTCATSRQAAARIRTSIRPGADTDSSTEVSCRLFDPLSPASGSYTHDFR